MWDLASQWLSHTKSKTLSLSNFPFLNFKIVILFINMPNLFEIGQKQNIRKALQLKCSLEEYNA